VNAPIYLYGFLRRTCSCRLRRYDDAMLKILSLLTLLLCSGHAIAAPAVEPALEQPATLSISAAHTLIDLGRNADAIGVLKQLVENTPTDFQAWFLLGVTQAKERRFHDAVASFGKVVALQPKLAEPHNNLAVIYNALGNFRAAVKELEASLKLKPDYATAHENIGDLYVKLAADAYRKALKEGGRPALRQRYNRLLHIRTVNQPEADTRPTSPSRLNTAQRPASEMERTSPENTRISEPTVIDTITKQSPKPAPTDGKKIAAQADIMAAMAAVEAWRSAWSRQDLPSYFAAYSDAFDFSGRFKTLEQWKHYKQSVITKRAFIRVTLENIKAKKLAGGEIRLAFLQHFRSDSFNSDDVKTMLLRQTQDGWKIIYEASK